MAWTIEPCLSSRFVDRVFVSTDDAEIAELSRAHGAEVPFLRPAALAGDRAPASAAVSHLLYELALREGIENPIVAVLQPTFPFRQSATVDECFRLFEEGGVTDVHTFSLADIRTGSYFFSEGGSLIPLRFNQKRGRGSYFQHDCVNISRDYPAYDPLTVDPDRWSVCGAGSPGKTRSPGPPTKGGGRFVETNWEEALDIDSAEDLEMARFLLHEGVIHREMERAHHV